MLCDVLNRIADKPPAVTLSEDCIRYLRDHEIPDDIIADLAASSYADWIQVGPLMLLPISQIIEQTTGISRCIENGFLPLAGGANGDPVVMDRRTRRMLFVSHEILWDRRLTEFSKCLHATPFRYEEFWEAAVSDESFPWDYYEAQTRWPHERL